MTPGIFYPPASLLEALQTYDPACGTGGVLLSNPPFMETTTKQTETVAFVMWCAEHYWTPQIHPVDVIKCTNKTVTLVTPRHGTIRHSRISSCCSYHDTWEQAHACLLKKAEEKVISARRQLEIDNGYLGNVKGMKKPEGVV